MVSAVCTFARELARRLEWKEWDTPRSQNTGFSRRYAATSGCRSFAASALIRVNQHFTPGLVSGPNGSPALQLIYSMQSRDLFRDTTSALHKDQPFDEHDSETGLPLSAYALGSRSLINAMIASTAMFPSTSTNGCFRQKRSNIPKGQNIIQDERMSLRHTTLYRPVFLPRPASSSRFDS